MMRSKIPSLLLIFFSGIIFILLLVLAVFLLLAGSVDMLGILPNVFKYVSLGQSFFQALSLIIIGMFMLPMGFFNVRYLLGKFDTSAELRNLPVWLIYFLIAAWFLIVLNADRIVAVGGIWTRVAEIPLFYISIGLPIFIILWISLGGISLGSKRRLWTIFGLGLVLGPILILISEITIFVISVFAGIIIFAKNPTLNHELMAFFNQLTSINSIDGAQELLIPYITNPWIIVIILTFVSLIVPIIEEFLKPAGTWLAVNKNMTPQDGFVMGILSGAGYALFETLSAAGNVGEGWGMILLGRAGTDLLHIFNTGIVGWAMISDWKLKGWLKLTVVYMLSILIHGFWNGIALTLGISTYINGFNGDYSKMEYLGIGGVIGLSALSLLMIMGLRVINNKLRYVAIDKK